MHNHEQRMQDFSRNLLRLESAIASAFLSRSFARERSGMNGRAVAVHAGRSQSIRRTCNQRLFSMAKRQTAAPGDVRRGVSRNRVP
jgi:hypothetical protein